MGKSSANKSILKVTYQPDTQSTAEYIIIVDSEEVKNTIFDSRSTI